jgi:hypothetical protein
MPGMEMDVQERSQQSVVSHPQEQGRPWSFRLAAMVLTLVTVAAATGFLLVPWLRPKGEEASAPPTAAEPTAAERLFRNWPKPDVALVLTGQQHGYMQPCGCTDPQFGGLPRRYNFLQSLQKRGWPIVAADLGEVAQESGPQKQVKLNYSMEALNRLNYTAVGIGVTEALMPLSDALANILALNNAKLRVVCANFIDKDEVFFSNKMLFTSALAETRESVPRVGFVGVIGPTLAQDLQTRSNDDVRFEAADKVLLKEIRALEEKQAELLVLLFLGTAKEAKAYATKFPQFQVILCWCDYTEPSEKPDLVGNTLIIGLGQKGRYVGVVGVNRTGKADKPFDLRYELVQMSPEYETPKGQEDANPMYDVMERYAKDVRNGNYLAKYLQVNHPLQIDYPEATYVGSDTCRRCHKAAYEVWNSHPHSHAYKTLENAKHPSLRQYDGECVVCHTTGFGYQSGYRSEKATPKLLKVGCESCHGPASLHVKDQNDLQLRAALNPWKAKPGEDPEKVATRIQIKVCNKCHDEDNSYHFKYEEYWYKKKTAHPTPKGAGFRGARP